VAPETPRWVRAQAVAERSLGVDKRGAIAKRYGCKPETLDAWSAAVETDPDFAALVRIAARRLVANWRPTLHRVIGAMGAEVLRRLESDPASFSTAELLGAIRFFAETASQADGLARRTGGDAHDDDLDGTEPDGEPRRGLQ
jgi:hypothetical protein